MGYHSNDARSTVVTQIPGDPTTPQGASPLLVRSRGGEVGIRTKAVPNFDSSVGFFYIRQNSELFFSGDTGDTTAGLPSQRTGIEFANDYRLKSWLHIDGDLALSRARFLGFDDGQEALYQYCRVSADPDRHSTEPRGITWAWCRPSEAGRHRLDTGSHQRIQLGIRSARLSRLPSP